MRDHHTTERQQWLRKLQQPAAREIAWDIIAVTAGAVFVLVLILAGGYFGSD